MYVNGKFYSNRNVQSPLVTGYMRTRVSGLPVERRVNSVVKSFSSWVVVDPKNGKVLFSAFSEDAFQMCVAYAKAYQEQIAEMV